MLELVKNKPENPLKFLGEYILKEAEKTENKKNEKSSG